MSKVKVKEIIDLIEEFAPLDLAEKWDNVGLMIGNGEAIVSKIMLCLDVTGEIIDEAAEKGCELIVSHHPFIFHSLRNIDSAEAKGNNVTQIIKNDISVYSAHTNLDYADNGVNDCLFNLIAEALDFGNITIEESAKRIKDRLGAKAVKIIYGRNNSGTINNIMVACGAFDGNIKAVLDTGADTLLVGEIKYNDSVDLAENGITILEAGHYDTEKIILPVLRKYLSEKIKDVEFYLTTNDFKVNIIY